jgi:GNAT superfamily N-acetyltransferase
MSEPIIRSATEIDFQSWLPLWHGYQAFYKVDIPEATTLHTWRRLLDPQEPMHLALAELDHKVVGLVHFIEHRSCWTVGDYIYLQDLFTDPGVRGRGVGRALIDHVYTRAAELGCTRVWWLTHESNQTAMRLYDKLAQRSGFVQYRKAI